MIETLETTTGQPSVRRARPTAEAIATRLAVGAGAAAFMLVPGRWAVAAIIGLLS